MKEIMVSNMIVVATLYLTLNNSSQNGRKGNIGFESSFRENRHKRHREKFHSRAANTHYSRVYTDHYLR